MRTQSVLFLNKWNAPDFRTMVVSEIEEKNDKLFTFSIHLFIYKIKRKNRSNIYDYKN